MTADAAAENKNPTPPKVEFIKANGRVPMELWGKDHRTTLMYAETRAVDYRGVLSTPHMREDGNTYPTYLASGVQLRGHNDYDCLLDAQAAGLLHLSGNRVEFTDDGWEYVGKLRRARAEFHMKETQPAPPPEDLWAERDPACHAPFHGFNPDRPCSCCWLLNVDDVVKILGDGTLGIVEKLNHGEAPLTYVVRHDVSIERSVHHRRELAKVGE